MTRAMTDDEIADLSDEEFESMEMPASPPAEEPAQEEEAETVATGEEETNDEVAAEDEADVDGEDTDDIGSDEEEKDGDGDFDGENVSSDPDAGDDASNDSEQSGDGDTSAEESGNDLTPGSEKEEKESEETKDGEPDYKSLYEKLMAPFKANGKEIRVDNPEELIQLAQMGANYTKKMQALQPHLKVVRMLENHGILDEAKLSYLIDLDKRDPAAIQKLVKDAGIDPMDIDTDAEPSYKPTNRGVSDEEWRFTSTLDEVVSTPAGKEIIQTIQGTWDKSSKDALWNDPNIMRVMQQHKEAGWYDQIAGEVERRQTLGHMQGVPFITAYNQIGHELTQAGKLNQAQATTENHGSSSSQKVTPRVESRRIVSPKRKTVVSNDKVKAATPPKSKPVRKSTPADFNPLNLSDEEFEKQLALGAKL